MPDERRQDQDLHDEPVRLVDNLLRMLWALGVRVVFGICGKEITPLWLALLASRDTPYEITTIHVRHENGGGYAAVGSWAFDGKPAGLFTTTGPGITNAITSLETARAAGAKLVLMTPLTPVGKSGCLGIQDTGNEGYRNADVHAAGRLFDHVALLQSPSQLPILASRLAAGFASPGPFLAHIAFPASLQSQTMPLLPVAPRPRRRPTGISPALADEIIELLAAEPFAVWVGWGAREHAPAIRRLLDITGAPVMSSPRGLGVADRHPQFIGVTGNGGRKSTIQAFLRHAPARTLVLGTAMGEATSRWMPELVPLKGFIHVDHAAHVLGRAYPHVPTLDVHADIGEVLDALLARADRLLHRPPAAAPPARGRLTFVAADERQIHPATLMGAIQRVIVDATEIPIVADAASSMFWGARHLVFREPGRWFVENRFGAMGNASGAVLGTAIANHGTAVAIVGDGALHMQDEINTAVRYGIKAVWIVLNDSGLGIVRNGMKADGMHVHDGDFPETDFAAVAVAKGARGLRVTREADLDDALLQAIEADGPFVIDVVIDPDAVAPIGARTLYDAG